MTRKWFQWQETGRNPSREVTKRLDPKAVDSPLASELPTWNRHQMNQSRIRWIKDLWFLYVLAFLLFFMLSGLARDGAYVTGMWPASKRCFLKQLHKIGTIIYRYMIKFDDFHVIFCCVFLGVTRQNLNSPWQRWALT